MMKRAIRIGAIVLGVLILIGLILPRLVNVNSFRPRLETELSTALNRQVRVGNLSLSVFSGTVSADNISIADDTSFSKDPFVSAKLLKAAVNIRPLIFSKTLHITGITLEEPQITLLRRTGGSWNFSSIGKSSAATATEQAKPAEASGSALSVDKLNVDKGRLLVGTANSAEKPAIYDNVNIEVSNFSSTTQFPFALTAALPGGGDLSLKGKGGPINASDTAATPFEPAMTVRKLDLAASTGIKGLADFDGVVNSNGQQLKASGTLKADKLQLAAKGAPMKRTATVKYATDHNLKADAGTLTQGDIAIGKALARLTGTYQTQGQTTSLNLKINAANMPVDEIEAALPALGVVLPSGSKLQAGALSADLAIVGPVDKLVITGPIRLSNAKLAGFDLGSKLSAIPALSGKAGGKDTTLQNVSTTVRVAPEGTQANAINVTIPSLGVVTGAGTVSSSGALNFEMNADLSGRSGAGVVQKAGIGGQGGGIPFSIEGTTSDPKFVPNVKAIAGKAIASKVGAAIPAKQLPGRLGRRRN